MLLAFFEVVFIKNLACLTITVKPCILKQETEELMNSILEETKFLLKKYHISANKSLGQNFLVDDEVVNTIVASANINKNDLVIEIGPGLGTLTARLLEQAGKVIAIELDDRMVNILQDRFQFYDNFELLHEDILKVDLKKKISEEISNIEDKQKEQSNQVVQEPIAKSKSTYTVKIVANLPYYITTPIIMKLLEDKLPIESITVMVQKEVADRLTAIPSDKNTGAITYPVFYYCEPSEVLLVPNSSFIPAPEVNSEVIQLKIRQTPPVELKDEKLFFKVIKASFMQRRKTLLNGLTNGGIASKDVIKKMLSELGLNENVRGESLTIQQFAEISNCLSSIH